MDVVGPLIQGKFHVPERRRGAVARPRLSERLGGASWPGLTLVSAPAGFGKTTLLTEWLAAAPVTGPAVAWLSLDAQDNDPTLFWTYVVAALQTAADGVGAGALSLLTSSPPSIDVALATLLNDLRAVPHDIVLVLDDYHVIEAGDVHDGMAFLLEHLPPHLHLVIATRTDPALALARMRGRGELLEVRAADLRFTPAESAAYLTEKMGLVLTAQDVAALDMRTEGWIAALQLAALSMQGRDDASAFIAGFAGDDRYIVDYLAEEVLARQPADVRDFLLRTSILDRLSGPLCDAVTGRGGGNAELAALERRNLFLSPLDERRRWYRYHQLFADVLQTHLTEQHPGEVPDLHRRASAWYEHNGEPAAAVQHALAAGDVEQAAGLIELAVPNLQKARREATIRGWLDAIPDDVVRVRPVLAVGFIGALMSGGEFEGVERRLQDVDRWLEPTGTGTPPAGMVVVDEGELRRLPAAVEMYRAALALVRGDAPATLVHARLAIDRAADEDHLTRAAASALSGIALWGGGDLEASDRWIDDSWTVLLTAGTFALGYVLLRRLLVVVTVTAVLMSIVAGVSAPRLSTDSNGDIQLLGRLTAMQEHGELAGYQDLAVADINLDSPQPVRLAGLGATATTPMEVRSLTKAMTGLVIADAVARGEVRMDAPVSTYLPQLWGSAAGVSSATFGYLSHFTREGVLRWLSGKHRRLVDHDQHRGAGREPKPRSRHAKVASPTIIPSNDMHSHDRSEPHPPPSPAVGARRRPHP